MNEHLDAMYPNPSGGRNTPPNPPASPPPPVDPANPKGRTKDDVWWRKEQLARTSQQDKLNDEVARLFPEDFQQPAETAPAEATTAPAEGEPVSDGQPKSAAELVDRQNRDYAALVAAGVIKPGQPARRLDVADKDAAGADLGATKDESEPQPRRAHSEAFTLDDDRNAGRI